MDRPRASTTCRCGYSSPTTLARCLGCGRRLQRCDRVVPVERPAPTRPASVDGARPRRVPPSREVSAFSGRDLERFGAAASMPAEAGPAVLPLGPVAVAGLVAAAWVGPEGPRPEILTAAALLGAALSARRVVPVGEPAVPSRLTDDELRDALAAW